MSNSPLISYTKLSPHYNPRGTNVIKKITPHHMAGNATVEACGEMFANPNRNGSSNYGIDSSGKIAMYVEEHNRAWTSSSPENDYQAITIEVANCTGAPDWKISDKALESLINLCVDICQRNNIPKLNYTGDKSGNLTMHCWFTPTECPGPYLKSKFPYIEQEVNKRLAAAAKDSSTQDKESTPEPAFTKGQEIHLKDDATYVGGKPIPAWVKDKTLYYRGTNKKGVIFSILKVGPVTGVVPADMIEAPVPFRVKIKQHTIIYNDKGTAVGKVPNTGVYTITDIKQGYYKLKSGAGWIRKCDAQ
jgi:hypothetical protein